MDEDRDQVLRLLPPFSETAASWKFRWWEGLKRFARADAGFATVFDSPETLALAHDAVDSGFGIYVLMIGFADVDAPPQGYCAVEIFLQVVAHHAVRAATVTDAPVMK
jgi:hypothetical protein